jgi:tRNA uridine 5-carboxymethylaminomethyl modification enzyme
MAGINAVLKLKDKPCVVLDRSEAYIGVLIDDLITKDAREPYRMFTSRAEYRLLLRHGNADLRLTETAREIGLIPDDVYGKFCLKRRQIEDEIRKLEETKPRLTEETRRRLVTANIDEVAGPCSTAHLLRRQGVTYEALMDSLGLEKCEGKEIIEEVEIQIKYSGYIKRQIQQIDRFKRMENKIIPSAFSYDHIPGFSNEVKEKFKRVQPASIGQASRISGVTPAAISVLIVAVERFQRGISTSL